MMKKTLTWATANFYFLMNLIEFPLANFWKQNFFFAWPNNQLLEYFYHFKQTLKFCNFHPWQSKKIFYFLLATIFMRIFNIFEKLYLSKKVFIKQNTYTSEVDFHFVAYKKLMNIIKATCSSVVRWLQWFLVKFVMSNIPDVQAKKWNTLYSKKTSYIS